MDSSDNESYKQTGLENVDDDGYGHSDDHFSVDLNNSEGNDDIAHICYFFNTPKGREFGDRCRYYHIIEYTHAADEQAGVCSAQTFGGGCSGRVQ